MADVARGHQHEVADEIFGVLDSLALLDAGLHDRLVAALGADTTAADLRQEIEFERASNLRLAQGLRVIRDTTSPTSVYGQIASRALAEAGVPDPPDEDHP